MDDKEFLLEQLTGVNSSKLNYYVELKQRSQELLKQNSRLELLNQLARDINIDMSIEDILDRVFAMLPEALPGEFLGLATLRGRNLVLGAMAPREVCSGGLIPPQSKLWQVVESRAAACYDPGEDQALLGLLTPGLLPQPRSLAVTPLFEREDLSGLLLVGSGQPEAYTQAELHFVQHLANQLAISLQNARLYKQVERSRKEWEATFRAVTDAIFLVDTDYRILQHNNRLPVELAGYWEQVTDNRCFARLKNRTEPCPNCPIDEIRRSGKPIFRREQTNDLVLDLSYYPVYNEDNQLMAVTHIIKDVTKKSKLEAQLVQSAKLAALGEMAAGVAHELNSPMTVIIGTAQLLLREHPEDGELLEDIANCGLRCKRIIQNLLTFSRQEQLPFDEVDLNAEVEGVLGLMKFQIDQQRIRITTLLDPQLPRITANGQQIQQVLANFLVNARDALEEAVRNEKSIKIVTGVRRENKHCWVTVSVQDNGVGIPAANLEKIFTPFFTSKEVSRGTGLGLSVSLGIAQSHRGTIEVESRPGEGSSFSLVLPADTAGNGNDETPSRRIQP
ncbi:MAG TPA: ATP-binding protein [Geothermobacteraceae bacterium]|nr:ATP-binding protein [Geothermobacteraceae bacterium]